VRQAIQISREAFLLGAWRNGVGAHGLQQTLKMFAEADFLVAGI
jgi:hypothetical protein